MTILLTAFEPFGGEERNASLDAMALVPDALAGLRVVKRTLPVAFGASVDMLRRAVLEVQPDAVLCLGQAAGRADITPERVAINLDDARIPDNAGHQPIDRPIAAQGPPAYFSTLPVKAMAAAIRAAGLPASVSNTAGTYVCNHLMYGLLHLLAQDCPHVRGGFMHVPMLTEQAAAFDSPLPGLSAEEIALGIRAALAAIADNSTDIHAAAGRED
ncbi:MAG: pyroglutamyl-peptidase I [Clostridiales bacterium]|nr:pyroglutamyl-peptidase I [Clostridiales bacterium]